MDKRRAWREQEQQLLSRWNAANERHRNALAELARPEPSAAMRVELERALAEVEALRRQIARLKVEFNQGKRY